MTLYFIITMIQFILSKIKHYYEVFMKYVQIIYKLILSKIREILLKYIPIIILLGFITFKQGFSSVLLNSITNDSIFSAIDFIVESTKKNTFVANFIKPFIDNMNVKFNLPITDRYIYYVLIEIVSNIFSILFWGKYNILVYHLLIFSTCPYILEYIASYTMIHDFLKFINNKIEKLKKHMLLSFFSFSFNHVCLAVINKNPKIKIDELKIFYKHPEFTTHLTNFLKTVITLLLIQYMESIGSLYTSLIKMLYNYGVIVDLNVNNIDSESYFVDNSWYTEITDPKEKILKIVEKREWGLIFNSDVLQIILKLYRENKGTSILSKIKEKIKYLEFVMGKFFTFYSISVLFNSPYISFILSMMLLYIEKYSIIYYIPRLLSLLFWICVNDILLVTIISEFFELLYNGVINYLIFGMYKKIYDYRYLLIHENKYNVHIFLAPFAIHMIWSTTSTDTNKLLLLFLLTLISKHMYFTLYFGVFGLFSQYNLIHLASLIILLYIFINIYNFKTTPINHVNLNIVNSYISNYSTNVSENFNSNLKIKLIDSYISDNYSSINICDTDMDYFNKRSLNKLNYNHDDLNIINSYIGNFIPSNPILNIHDNFNIINSYVGNYVQNNDTNNSANYINNTNFMNSSLNNSYDIMDSYVENITQFSKIYDVSNNLSNSVPLIKNKKKKKKTNYLSSGIIIPKNDSLLENIKLFKSENNSLKNK